MSFLEMMATVFDWGLAILAVMVCLYVGFGIGGVLICLTADFCRSMATRKRAAAMHDKGKDV